MFTGIIHIVAVVLEIDFEPDLMVLTLQIDNPKDLENLVVGASIAVDGVCLTVVFCTDRTVQFEVIPETWNVTTLASLKVGDCVNMERSLRVGDELGGHLLSGHVHGKGIISDLQIHAHFRIMTLTVPKQWNPYLFSKGFIALCGCSLTIVDVFPAENSFTVHLIPETLSRSVLGDKQKGDHLNFEIDQQTRTIVDTVTRLTSASLT